MPGITGTGRAAFAPGQPALVPPGAGTPPARPVPRARRAAVRAGVVLAGLACLAAAVVAGGRAWAAQTRQPTAAERSAAAAAAIGRRWRTWPAGRIFPPALGYTTSLLTHEKATRVGISPADRCAAALAGAAVTAARHDGCRAAVRATYVGALHGIVYTVGVLAFPGRSRAAAFARAAGHEPLSAGLRAYGLAGTVSARFTDGAREAATARQAGPYVVLVVAGYADGRSAAAAGEHRAGVFAPGRQLATDVLTPLARTPAVRCGQAQWAC